MYIIIIYSVMNTVINSIKDKHTFIAEKLIITCSFEGFHSKHLEYIITKDHIAIYIYNILKP